MTGDRSSLDHSNDGNNDQDTSSPCCSSIGDGALEPTQLILAEVSTIAQRAGTRDISIQSHAVATSVAELVVTRQRVQVAHCGIVGYGNRNLGDGCGCRGTGTGFHSLMGTWKRETFDNQDFCINPVKGNPVVVEVVGS